jgi:hypothetical protein
MSPPMERLQEDVSKSDVIVGRLFLAFALAVVVAAWER